MDAIEATLNLDFNQNKSYQTVNCAQGDDLLRYVVLKLYDNGERVTLGLNDTATLNASTDGVITVTGQSCNILNNAVYVQVTDELTALPGTARCMVKITAASGVVHTARFDLNIEPDPVNADMPECIATTSIVSRLENIENSYVASTTVRQIVTITESAYDALATKDSSTMYCILPDPET